MSLNVFYFHLKQIDQRCRQKKEWFSWICLLAYSCYLMPDEIWLISYHTRVVSGRFFQKLCLAFCWQRPFIVFLGQCMILFLTWGRRCGGSATSSIFITIWLWLIVGAGQNSLWPQVIASTFTFRICIWIAIRIIPCCSFGKTQSTCQPSGNGIRCI